MSDGAGPERTVLDAFDLLRSTSAGSDELFDRARAIAADYDEPGDLAAGVASVAAMLLRVLADVTSQPADAILDQLYQQLGTALLKRNEDDS